MIIEKADYELCELIKEAMEEASLQISKTANVHKNIGVIPALALAVALRKRGVTCNETI